MTDAEREGVGALVRVDRDARADPQAAEGPQRRLARPLERRGDVLVDRGGEALGEALLGRRRHQVDVADEHVGGGELLHGPPDQRRLAVPARSEDHHVLTVDDVELELLDLALAIGECLVQGQILRS